MARIPFTSETARDMAQRSAARRRLKAYKFPQLPKEELEAQEQENVQAMKRQHLAIVVEQIKSTRKILNDEDYSFCMKCKRKGIEANHRAQLLKALDSLLDRHRLLLGIPNPGTLKPQSPKRTKSQDAQPLD